MAEYFFKRDEQVYGPIDFARLQEEFESGGVTTSDQLSHAPDGPWQPFLAMFPAFAAALPPAETVPATKFSPLPEHPEETAKPFLSRLEWILLSALLAVVLFWAATANWRARWVYRVVVPLDAGFEEQLNKYGADGWEIISVRRAAEPGKPLAYEIVMKRRR
ncbi:hypothetical protein AYO41_00235 [Verrucomicrobia bacterium SCGC AG-212-E04]|nr:hypothetical protein AYO41_00235 [Verrucomicrobia bacterium SCGC AG-212-E04]